MRPRSLIALAALAIGALLAPTTPAVAAPVTAKSAVVAPTAAKSSGKVSIKKIANKTVAKGKKATVKPSYKRTGQVKITSAKLSATKSGKSVAKNKPSVKLGAGTYKIKQKVSYKLRSGKGWGKTRSTTLSQTLKVSVSKAKPTKAQKNALGMAKDYLEMIPFSKAGLIEQLRYEGFSAANAKWAADRVGANWNKEAAKKANQYLDIFYFSRDGLIEQLRYDGFTAAQARYGANAVGL